MKNTFAEKIRGIGDSVASAAGAASNAAGASYAAVKGSAGKVGQSALEFGKSAGVAMGEAAQATSVFTSKAGDAVSESASKSFAVVKQGASSVGESASAGAKTAGAAPGMLVGDLNGDGKVDFEDAKIAAAKVRSVAGAAGDELGQLGKSALQSKLVQDAAASAVVGGVLASMIPLPIISTAVGATAGTALGAFKSIGNK